uniref:Uncharacterized protein n=1 Tax=Nelumbo nucifera TaxID=4432 RepID=A0A822ZQT8_NELNU|nr:TPA_asm: hypothetical protein HUJ06_018281 [Nelumbo nucifera]
MDFFRDVGSGMAELRANQLETSMMAGTTTK